MGASLLSSLTVKAPILLFKRISFLKGQQLHFVIAPQDANHFAGATVIPQREYNTCPIVVTQVCEAPSFHHSVNHPKKALPPYKEGIHGQGAAVEQHFGETATVRELIMLRITLRIHHHVIHHAVHILYKRNHIVLLHASDVVKLGRSLHRRSVDLLSSLLLLHFLGRFLVRPHAQSLLPVLRKHLVVIHAPDHVSLVRHGSEYQVDSPLQVFLQRLVSLLRGERRAAQLRVSEMCCHHQRAAEVLRVAEIESREVAQNRQREHRDRRGRDVAVLVVFVDDGERVRGVRPKACSPAAGE